MLTKEEVTSYNKNGYLLVENAVSESQLIQLRRLMTEFIDKSRHVRESNEVYDLDKGHGPDTPRLTRIKIPHKQHPYFWEVLRHSRMTEVLQSLLGPDTTIITSKLNTKAPGGGAAVEWHQDWAFYPHNNDDLLAFGLMLEDVDEENGPLMVIPESHRGPILDHHANGVFAGAINPEDPLFKREKMVKLTGKAGTMTVHHARTLHGSAPNISNRQRSILFYEIAKADAWPILGAASYIHKLGQTRFWEDLQERVITGKASLMPRLEKVPVLMPLPPAPDNSSIFKTQESAGAKSSFG